MVFAETENTSHNQNEQSICFERGYGTKAEKKVQFHENQINGKKKYFSLRCEILMIISQL